MPGLGNKKGRGMQASPPCHPLEKWENPPGFSEAFFEKTAFGYKTMVVAIFAIRFNKL